MLASRSPLSCPRPPQPVRARAPSTSARITAKSLPLGFVAIFPPAVCTFIVEPPPPATIARFSLRGGAKLASFATIDARRSGRGRKEGWHDATIHGPSHVQG